MGKRGGKQEKGTDRLSSKEEKIGRNAFRQLSCFICLLLQSAECNVPSLLNVWLFWAVEFVMPACLKTEGGVARQEALLLLPPLKKDRKPHPSFLLFSKYQKTEKVMSLVRIYNLETFISSIIFLSP